jgi:hypothetical protein
MFVLPSWPFVSLVVQAFSFRIREDTYSFVIKYGDSKSK